MFPFETTIGSSYYYGNYSEDDKSQYSNSNNLNNCVNKILNISLLNNKESSSGKNNTIKKEEREIKEITNRPHFIMGKKRGKPAEKKNKSEHLAWSRDNIIRKIQIHFLNFVISFLNDCASIIFKKERINFKKFIYEKKRNSTIGHINMLKNFTINELLEYFEISKKYKRYNGNINKIYKEKLEQNAWFKKLLETKYTTLFKCYYNECQPSEEIFFLGEKIKLSGKTKPFNELLLKNKKYKEAIIETAEDVYFNNNI